MDDIDYNDYDQDNYSGNEQNEDVIELENMFYDAEDKLRDDPQGALSMFKQVIEKEEQLFQNKEERKQSFSSLKHSILLSSKIPGQLQIIAELLSKLLELFQYQYRNEGNEALNQILEALLNINEEGVSIILNKFIKDLQNLQLTQLFIIASTKLCRIYAERRQAENLAESISNVQGAIENIQDADRRNTLLTELYAYKIYHCNLTNQHSRIKDIYRQLLKLNVTIHDSRINATINETVGKMKMMERRWDQARKSLMEAFYNYQDSGNQQAKSVLIYAVIASILENYSLNLFDDIRARVYENDSSIQVMKQIRNAYDQKDIRTFNQVKQQLVQDTFLNEFLEELHKVISFSKIIQLMQCYTKLNLCYLAKILEVEVQVAQRYVQELILSGKINALIDQVTGFVESTQQNDQFDAISQLISSL